MPRGAVDICMEQIPDIVSAYGLGHLYRGHTMHGDFPLLNLHGFLRMDHLLERSTFVAYAEAEGMPAELWGGEVLQVRTSPSLVIEVEHTDSCLVGLVRGYIGAAGRAMQPQEQKPEPRWASPIHDVVIEYREVVSAPQVPLNEMTREERLDRARALRGKWVAQPPHHSSADREMERERVSRMTPGVTYRDLHPLDDDDYEPPTPYDLAMRRIRRVEGAPDSFLAPDDGAPRSREEDWYYR